MKSGMVYLRPARMVYVRIMGPYEQSIPEAWEKLFAWVAKNDLNSPVGRGYGLSHDNPSNTSVEKLRYDACLQLTPLYEERAQRELSVMTLPSGPYLRHKYTGGYEGIYGMVSGAHDAIEVPPELKHDARRPVVTIYLDDPARAVDGDLRAEICLPVSVASARDRANAA
ncbi:MAG: GyrI-like domain-containing protein [Hyphomicrobium sp.]